MILDAFADLNWLAVVVAALAYFALGAVWYSNALFGEQWRAATGQEMGEGGSPDPGPLVANFVGWLIAAIALGLISGSVGADTFADGLVLGLVVAIGFIGTNNVVGQMFEGRNPALMRVNAPYTLLGYSIMGIILALWT
jgi:hypothetical protein